MSQITKEEIICRTRTLMRRVSLAAMVASIISFALPVVAAPPLPSEPMPKPSLPGTFHPNPKPPIHIGTRPHFNPSNIGALPDLKIVRVTTRINSRVANICRTGRKDVPGSSIGVLNFDLVVKNVGRGTAYMNRDGVIVSAQTMDFHERVFDTSKYYLGGRGGPGHFIGPHGRQNWILKRMAHVKPGKTFTATSHLGVGYTNRTFTIARMHELAGQTHRFRIKLTSYGRPGLKESNTRNNEYIVSYTFPRNFCQPAGGIHVRPVGVPAPTLPTLPDLKIVRVTPRLNSQASRACRTGRSPHGVLVGFDLKVKNIGTGVADFSRYYFAVHATSSDGRTPVMRGGDGYHGARRTPTRVAPGQTFNITGISGVTGGDYGRPVTFPVSRYSELAGKTRRFKVEIISGTGFGHGLPESNYRNNTKTVSFTFPSNFCKATARGVPLTQTVGTLKPHLVIQSIHTQLRRPYECRTDGPTFADGDLVIKNTGGDYIPVSGVYGFFRLDGHLPVGRNRLLLSSAVQMPRIPAGATRHVRFAMTGTAGLLHTPTPPMNSLAGRTVPLFLSGLDFYGNRNSSIHFPSDFCAARTTGGISAPIGSHQTVKPNITGFQFAGGKSCVSPRGVFNIKGSAFGNAEAGRTIALGGNGVGFNLPIKSWNNRTIRVQLPRTGRLQYHKNYWVGIQAPAVAGSARTLSNLKRGVVLCPPTVHVGTSGSSGSPSAGRQNGGVAVTVPGATVTVITGLPDLEVSRLVISSPNPACFSLGPRTGARYYTLPTLNVSLTLHNKGHAPYSTLDAAHHRQLPIGIIGDRYVGPKDRHHVSLCMVPVAHMTFSNLNIPAGGSKTVQTQMQVMRCPFVRGKVVNQSGRLPDPLVRTLLGVSRPVKIGIGKAVFIHNKIPEESSYDNNYGQTTFRFPSRTCGGR